MEATGDQVFRFSHRAAWVIVVRVEMNELVRRISADYTVVQLKYRDVSCSLVCRALNNQ